MFENGQIELQMRIARVARYAKTYQGFQGFGGLLDDSEYKKNHPKPSIWWKGIEYKWNEKRGKYLHWVTLPNGKRRADEPPVEAMNPLFGDFSKPYPASRQSAETQDDTTTPKTTASDENDKEQAPQQEVRRNLLGETEKAPKKKKSSPKKSAPKKKEPQTETEDDAPRPLLDFDPQTYTDRQDEPRDLLSFANSEQESTSESKESEPQRETTVERLREIAEKVEQKQSQTAETTEKADRKSEPTTLKDRQLAEILEHNPMRDDYHLGIRTIDDIHTAEEVFNPDDPDAGDYEYYYPDFSRKDAESALKSGYITVYSSYELKSGTFVTPSRMNAQDYAGGRKAKVYSKRVPLNAVAWIDSSEGQYCPKAAKSEKTKSKTKERLRQIAEINAEIDEKPLAPMTTSGRASHESRDVQYAQNAEDFAAIAQRVRGEIMSARTAKKDDAATQEDVDEFHEVVPLFVATKKKLRDNGGVWDDESNKIWNEKLQPFFQKMNLRNQKSKTLTRAQREKNLAFLKAAFPDRGGEAFFSENYVEEKVEQFKKNKIGIKEDDLRYVFEMYNVLGKSFNTSNKWGSPPDFGFAYDENKSYGGEYSYPSNTLFLNINPESAMGIQAALIHEFGHWLEEKILGMDVRGENRDWLGKETGDGENFPKSPYDDEYNGVYMVPHEKAPDLCYRWDGYSLKTYPPMRDYGGKGGSEIFSTGMEGIGLRSDYFARCNPKHFNRMIECFSKLLKDKKE